VSQPATPAAASDESRTLKVTEDTKKSRAEVLADLAALSPYTAAMVHVDFLRDTFGECSLTETVKVLCDKAVAVHRGNLKDAETMLVSQATALNAIFTRFALRASMNMGEYLDATDRYMRLALRAQSQCRATLETLALIKNPPAVFARQANIAQGPQQVNNTVSVAHAGNTESVQNKVLEPNGQRLDDRTTQTSGSSDLALAPVGTVDRASDT
jgi:hypothetical protein